LEVLMSFTAEILDLLEMNSPEERFRRSLSEQERCALDESIAALCQNEFGAAAVRSLTPFESLLLLMLQKQHQRIESLEFLMRRHATRRLEDSLVASYAPTPNIIS
jgi:hypothetical protein